MSIPAGQNVVRAECCANPPEITVDYTPKGSFKPYGVFDKAYVVGPADAKSAVIFVYDIFGYSLPAQQGADILAERGNSLVVMPDFFRGKPFQTEAYDNPASPEAKGKMLQEFFGALGDFSKRLPELQSVAKQLRSEGATFIGAVGLCWGGRLCINAGESEGKEVDACAAVHPPMLNEKDGDALLVPIAMYPSGEDQLDVALKIYEKAKTKPFGALCQHKAYDTMHHGFAGTHAHLDKEDNKAEFQDVYCRLADFFNAAAK